MTDRTLLHTGAAAGLAAVLGFGAARLTQSSAPVPAPAEATQPEKPVGTLAITSQAIAASQIAVTPAMTGELDAVILASATVEATPDAQAVLTARAPGTITRIFARIGDTVRAGQMLALVESRDASQIAADRASASARETLAAKQLARERVLLAQGVSSRADFESAQANLAVAQADARRASAAAGATRVSGDGRSIAIVSPVAGHVTSEAANLGQFVAAETELFRVADPRRLQIIANVPPADAGGVRTGDRVVLTTGDGGSVEGRVRSSTGVVDPQSRAAAIIIMPSEASSKLAPGQLVQARILGSGGAPIGGVMIPQDAVQTLSNRTVVFIRTPSGFRAQTVAVRSRAGGMVAIDGLAAGVMIATTNAFLIKAELEKNEGGEE